MAKRRKAALWTVGVTVLVLLLLSATCAVGTVYRWMVLVHAARRLGSDWVAIGHKRCPANGRGLQQRLTPGLEGTGSIPVSRTKVYADQIIYLDLLHNRRGRRGRYVELPCKHTERRVLDQRRDHGRRHLRGSSPSTCTTVVHRYEVLAVTLCSSLGSATRTPCTLSRRSLGPASPQGRCSCATLR